MAYSPHPSLHSKWRKSHCGKGAIRQETSLGSAAAAGSLLARAHSIVNVSPTEMSHLVMLTILRDRFLLGTSVYSQKMQEKASSG